MSTSSTPSIVIRAPTRTPLRMCSSVFGTPLTEICSGLYPAFSATENSPAE